MAQFSVNPTRLDPYKQFKFRVKWDGNVIPGISQVSELRRTTDVVTHREGSSPNNVHRSPGLTSYDPIVLVRGRTHDPAFEQWANKVWNLGAGLGMEVSLADFRKDVTIDLLNEAGQLVMSFRVYRCWPSEYVPLTALDSGNSCVVYESITLEHEGWERDYEVTEPHEPQYDEPE